MVISSDSSSSESDIMVLDTPPATSFLEQEKLQDASQSKKQKKCGYCANEKCDCHKNDFSEHNIIRLGNKQ